MPSSRSSSISVLLLLSPSLSSPVLFPYPLFAFLYFSSPTALPPPLFSLPPPSPLLPFRFAPLIIFFSLLVFKIYVPVPYCYTAEFGEKGHLYKTVYLLLTAIGIRTQYYFAWCLSEGMTSLGMKGKWTWQVMKKGKWKRRRR